MTFLFLSSSSKNTLKLYTIFLVYLLKKLQIDYSLFSLPTTKKKITLLKSPHVYKKSKEQFEILNFKTVFSIKPKIEINLIKYLILNKPKSLSLKLKCLER